MVHSRRLVRMVGLLLMCLGMVVLPALTHSPLTYATSDETSEEVLPEPIEEEPEAESIVLDNYTDAENESSSPEHPPIEEVESEDASLNGEEDQEKEIEEITLPETPLREDVPNTEDTDEVEQIKDDDESSAPSQVSIETDDESKAVFETNGVLGLSLLSDIRLEGEFDGNNQITLRVIGRGLLNLNVLKDRYVLFNLPDSLFPYIDETSLSGTYNVPSINLIGAEIGRNSGSITSTQWTIDENRKQIAFRANQFLSVSLLSVSTYTFELTFRVNGFPLITPQQYDFYGHLTNDLVDIRALSDGRDQWTLVLKDDEIPALSLVVPEQINFGNFEVEPNMRRINRHEPMTVTVFHSRAKGTSWKLTAQASPLQSPSHTLKNTVFFTRKDGTTVTLEQGAQLIETGIMADVPTILDYGIDEGIHLDLQQQTPQPGTYNTIIEWTLIDSI